MRPKDLAGATRQAIPIAIAGMFVPLALGFALGWWWLPESEWKIAQSLFIGVALAVTAVPVAVKALLDLGQLQTRIGQVIVAAAVIDDVISLVLLAVLTAVISANVSVSAGLLATIVLNVAIFFAVAWITGRYLLPHIGRYVRRLDMEHAEFSLLIVYGLALSVIAELLDMHFLIGAFAAGVFFNRNVVGGDTYDRLRSQSEALTMGFLAPVFFASIGLHLDLSALREIPVFLVVFLLAATIGKLAGAGIAARMSGFSTAQSIAVGAAMNARGAVEIIIAGIALQAGLFDRPDPTPPAIEYLFSAVVIMAVFTTLVTPFALQKLLRERKKTG
jgi:Kef-type K+ transport system membrane component KefB